jgi:hypothetical protein
MPRNSLNFRLSTGGWFVRAVQTGPMLHGRHNATLPHQEKHMRQNESLRELSAAEIDEVAGGLSVSVGANAGVTAGAGVNVNANDVLGAVSGLVGQAGGLVSSLLGNVLGAVGGLAGGLTSGL